MGCLEILSFHPEGESIQKIFSVLWYGDEILVNLMASQKVRPTELRRFFRISTYLMYAFAPEKTPSLVGRNFCFAIPVVFVKASNC
jgi:hypothetical protein